MEIRFSCLEKRIFLLVLLFMKNRIVLMFLLVVLLGCQDSSVQEDMERYCDCLQKNKNNQEGREDCLILMEEIVQKYEYDPEALQEILEASEHCH